MKKPLMLITLLIFVFLTSIPIVFAAEPSKSSGPADILIVSGTVANAQGRGVRETVIHFFLNGRKVELKDEVATSKEGHYKAEISLPAGSLPVAKLELQTSKPAYKESDRLGLGNILKEKTDDQGNHYYLAHQNVTIKRVIAAAFWISCLILLAVYALIAFELMHRTLAALLGASLLLFITYTAGTFDPNYVILTFEDAMKAIDMNVIFLLMAMMIIVGVTKKTGVFQWLAYKSYQLARGNVYALSGTLKIGRAHV